MHDYAHRYATLYSTTLTQPNPSTTSRDSPLLTDHHTSSSILPLPLPRTALLTSHYCLPGQLRKSPQPSQFIGTNEKEGIAII